VYKYRRLCLEFINPASSACRPFNLSPLPVKQHCFESLSSCRRTSAGRFGLMPDKVGSRGNKLNRTYRINGQSMHTGESSSVPVIFEGTVLTEYYEE
jgi:hypothetical protein